MVHKLHNTFWSVKLQFDLKFVLGVKKNHGDLKFVLGVKKKKMVKFVSEGQWSIKYRWSLSLFL